MTYDSCDAYAMLDRDSPRASTSTRRPSRLPRRVKHRITPARKTVRLNATNKCNFELKMLFKVTLSTLHR